MADKVTDVYGLIADKGYFADEKEFRSYVSDPNKIKEVYSLIKDDGFFTDEKEFNSYFQESQKKSPSETTNGANVVTSKGGEPQLEPSTVSGTRDKFIIEPTEKNIQELAEKRISDLQGQSSMADARKYAIDEINKTNSRITGKLTLGDESRQMGIAKSDMGMPSREEQLVKADVVTSKGGEPQSVPSTVSGTRDKVPTTYQWSGGDVGMQQKVITPTNADSKSAVNVVTKEMTAGGRLAEEKEGYELSNKKSLAEQEASKSFSIATENYTYDQVKNLVQLQSLLNKTIEDNKDPKLAKQTQDVEVIKKQIENLRNQQVTPKYTLNAEGQTVSYIKPKYKNVGEMYDETIMFQNKHQKLIGEIENYETKLNPIIEKARKNAQYTPNKKDEYGNTYYDLNPMEAFLNGADNSLETTAIGLANMFGFDDEAKSAAQMKWYKDNVISPKKADGLVSQGFEMLGAVAPLVAGGAVASGSVLGSVVMNSLLFGALDYGGTWYNSYASKKAEGMSDEEASKEANSNARFAGVKGMILGGTMPLQSMAGNKVGVSLFVTKAEQNSFRQFMYGQIGMLPAFGTSTALQNWYEGKPVTDNVGRAMIDAFIIGGMTHAIASLPKLPAETARLFEHTIAKNYNKVSTVIDAAVQDGTINPTVGENIVAKAKAYDKIKGAGLNEDVEVQVTELQVQIDKLEASKEGASPAVIAEIDRQINELSTKLKVEAGFPLTFDERKELNLLQTARDSNKEYDKAKLAELEQRQKNNQDGKTKIVTDQPIRVKYKDGRTGLVFVNAEGDVEFVPDGNSAGLVIDKQAGASFRSLANLGFEQVVGETIAEPNSQLLSGDISLGTSVLYKGGKYQIASSKNAPDGVKLDTDGKVRVVYLKGEDGKVIAVGADSVDGKRIIDDANRVIGKGEATPTETAPIVEAGNVVVETKPVTKIEDTKVGEDTDAIKRQKRIEEIEGILSSDASSKQETGSGNLIKEAREELETELAELKKEQTPIASETDWSKDIENVDLSKVDWKNPTVEESIAGHENNIQNDKKNGQQSLLPSIRELAKKYNLTKEQYLNALPSIRQVLSNKEPSINSIENIISREGKNNAKAEPTQEVVKQTTSVEPSAEVEKTNFKPNKVLTGANKLISKVAEGYKKATKLFSKTPRLVTKVSDADGKRIADAFNQMKHEPNNPEVKKGFEQLITEIKKQADALIKEGFKFELVTEGKAYNSDSKKMLDDVKNNKRILIEASEGAFGTKRTFDQDNIGLQDSGYTDVNGRKLTNVELIRAVHDLFGHSEYGNGFGAIGEENAWRVHMSMFTPLAQKALTATTRGQNSWVNFGNHMRNADGSIKKKGDAGYLEPNKRPFAEQKIGFLPDWAMENAYGDRVKINGKEIKPTNKYVVDGKEVYEIDDAQAFFDAISSAKESRGDDGIQVALKTKEEYQKVLDEGGVLLVSKDGNVGVMLEANGNVGSGFSHSDVPKGENSLKPLLITAIKLGGRFTDAYEGYLPKYYAKFGFKPLYRMKFNPEFADKGWDKTILKSEPDVVFMYFDGNRETLEANYDKFPAYDKTQGEYVTDYDKATEGARAKSIEIEEQASLTPPPDAKAGATKKEATPQAGSVGVVDVLNPDNYGSRFNYAEKIDPNKIDADNLMSFVEKVNPTKETDFDKTDPEYRQVSDEAINRNVKEISKVLTKAKNDGYIIVKRVINGDVDYENLGHSYTFDDTNLPTFGNKKGDAIKLTVKIPFNDINLEATVDRYSYYGRDEAEIVGKENKEVQILKHEKASGEFEGERKYIEYNGGANKAFTGKIKAVEQSLKEAPQTENKVQQASEQVQKFKDVLDQRTDKKTDKALKAFGEQAEKAKELIDNYDTNLKKLEEKGVEVKGTKEEILADMLDGKYDEALKSDTSIPSSKTEIERRPIQMLDGEDGIELIVKNEDGTETSMGKFYANDTKEMDKIERGLKLADQQKSKANENKTEIQKANEEVWKAIQDLLDAGDITNLGFAAKNVGEKSSEALDRLHKALVNSAKTYLKAGGTSLKQFAKNIGLSAKNAKQAWDEAMGLTTFNKDNLDYDLADIAKVAIRRGIKVREKLLEVIDEQKTKTKNVTKSLQAIRDFVKEYSDRGNLTRDDYQKILDILPSIKNQKTLDKAADKILDIINNAKSDKIEVSERTLLKDRIKAEVKAANEGYRQARLEQKDIAQAIKAFMDDTEIKGALTPSQVKALVKRAASITTDAQFDKFIDYADKIIKDANLAQDLEDLRSNQKGAGKRRHNEKTADVRKFLDAEIFDEDGNLLLDEATFSEYSDAVAALNQKIPDHSLMEATDASGKTLSERVADQSQSASNPYMNINTVKDLMKAWTAIDNNIVDVDSYKSFTRNISKIKARLKDLVQAGTIKQDDYDTAISQIYKHENGKRVYEAKYGDQIGQLKSAQIADAQAKARLVDDSGFNKMQKELWQEFKHNMSVNFEKFKKLEVSDLDKLNTVLDRMGNGFMPEYEFRQVMNKIETQGQGVKIAKQVAKISDKFKNNLDKLRDLFETNDPARYEGELGIAGDKSLWNGVLSRTQRALKKYTETTHDMYEKWYDSLPSFYKITGKKPVLIDKIDAKDGKVGKTVVSQREYDMVKVGAVRHMINHAAEMMAKGKDPIDVFGEQLADIKERQNYATEGELSILTDVYNKLKSNPDLLDINGELDYNKIWKSVEANDGKVLDVNQAKIESSFDGLDLETGDMITSSNAIQGVNATKNPKHIRRYYVGTRVGEGEINESGQIGIRAGSSYARADKDMPSGAMLLNAEKIIQRQIKEAAKDYHLNQELDKLDYVFEEAKLAANREDINVLNEFQQDQRRIMQYHLSSGDIPPIFNKIQGGLYVKMLTTPVRLSAEAVSNTTQMLLRGKSLKGILTSVPSQTINPFFKEMTDIMKATESTSLDHAEFRSMKNIETKDGQIQREGLLKRGVDVINGVTNAMAVGGIWMPNFNRKFAELTGENYNNSMLKNPKYVDAMREASSYADRETETVIGSTLKGGSRRVIVLTPFGGKLKADSTLGSLAKFLSNYPYRDTKELVRGINQMVTGVNEGRIDGAARSMGVVTNMMLYTGIYAISKAVWEQTFGDDDEKKEAKETIDRLSTKEGFLDFTKQEALSNAVNLAGTKYSQAGKMMTRLSVIALYNSNLLDETQKKDLANFAEAQLYMYFNKKSFRKSDVKSEFYNVIPHLKEASDIFYREVEGEEGVTALLKEAREKGVEGLTKDKQAKLSLLKNFIHTTNILLYSQGTQLPFSKDFVKSLDAQIKELNK